MAGPIFSDVSAAGPGLADALVSGAQPDGGSSAFASLRDRIAGRLAPGASVVPAERVTLLQVDLPLRGRARRLQALPYAIEDRLAVPVETVHCALHPGAAGGGTLAAVIDRGAMAEADGALVPETMAVPTPPAEDGRAAWAVWREGERAVVRVSDGTGFAARAGSLPMLWTLAGKPPVLRLRDGLPEEMGAVDRSDAPPPPDAEDLRFDLRQGAFAPGGRHWPGTARIAAGIVLAGTLAHLGLALADRAALSRIADAEAARAGARLEARLPGVPEGIPPAALIDRLAPRTVAAGGSAFLPLLTDAAAALTIDAPRTQVQRLTWDGRSDELLLDVTAGSLEGLQEIERTLVAAGLPARSGVATADDGVARAEIRIGPRP